MLNEWLPGHLRAKPDLTLEEHREAFEEAFGVKVSTATVSRAISGLSEGNGWPLKKVEGSLRARRGDQGALAVASEPL
jgi:transposase